VTEFREGGTVISAMFTGTKLHNGVPVDVDLDSMPGRPVEQAGISAEMPGNPPPGSGPS
jgi:hypothetical protein